MTTELTKAAQQALEQLEFLNACYPHKTATDASDALRRALTQRPAAQAEREAFEAWFDDYYDKACAEFGGIDCTDPKGIAEDAWQARASLPAPQQATPERHLTVTTNQQGEAVMVSWQDDEHRILDVVWERKPATPEPVGEVVAYREKLTGRLCEPEDTHRRKFPMCYEPLTRPAPGVPEGWRNVIAGTLKTDPWDSARVADYNSGWNDCQRKTLRGLERLAAAQANGGAA